MLVSSTPPPAFPSLINWSWLEGTNSTGMFNAQNSRNTWRQIPQGDIADGTSLCAWSESAGIANHADRLVWYSRYDCEGDERSHAFTLPTCNEPQ